MANSNPDPSVGMIVPFIVQLLLIAVAPFVIPTFWSKHFHHISFMLAAIVVIYYLAALNAGPRMLETLGNMWLLCKREE
jgi:hypothetical protein